jgi:hypothetical protein
VAQYNIKPEKVKQKSNFFSIVLCKKIVESFSCVFLVFVIPLGMIKNKDVVVDRQGRVFQVVNADYRTDRLGKQILCRLYRSQKRFAFMPWQIKKHPFFS